MFYKEKEISKNADKAQFVESGSTFMHEMVFNPLLNSGSDATMKGYTRREDRAEPQDKVSMLRNFVIRVLDAQSKKDRPKNRYLMAQMSVYKKVDLSLSSFTNNRTHIFTIYPTAGRNRKGEIVFYPVHVHTPDIQEVKHNMNFLDELQQMLIDEDDNIKSLMVGMKRQKASTLLQAWLRTGPFKTYDDLVDHCTKLKLQGWDHGMLAKFYKDYNQIYFL